MNQKKECLVLNISIVLISHLKDQENSKKKNQSKSKKKIYPKDDYFEEEKIKEKSFGHFPIDCLEAYIAGATENGIRWHDLRKDPNDLPNDDRNVYVATLSPYETKENVFEYHFDSWLGDDWFSNSVKDVIAWCEIPQFKE